MHTRQPKLQIQIRIRIRIAQNEDYDSLLFNIGFAQNISSSSHLVDSGDAMLERRGTSYKDTLQGLQQAD